MDINKIAKEIQANGSRKINIGIKVYPEFKKSFAQEATDLGITMCELGETRLHEFKTLNEERRKLINEVEMLEEKIWKFKQEKLRFRAMAVAEVEKLRNENLQLQKKLLLLDELNLLIDLPKFQDLFSLVKGRKDVIVTPDGKKIDIIYNGTKNLLYAMILAYEIK